MSRKLSSRFVFNSLCILLFAAFIAVCAAATWKTYVSCRDGRVTAYIAFPSEGEVTFNIDSMAFIKDPQELIDDCPCEFLGELSFSEGSISEDTLSVGDRLNVIISEDETVEGEVLMIKKETPISHLDTEYLYYIGFDSDDFSGTSVRMQYSSEPESFEYTLPSSAVHSDTSGSYVFVTVPEEGVLGTEYITRKVDVTAWPQDGCDTVAILDIPEELKYYPTVITTDGSLRSRKTDGAGVSVNLEAYE